MLTHGSVTMVYDGDGNRVAETIGGVTTKYLVDTLNPTGFSQVMGELVSGTVTRTYAYGLQRISEDQLVASTWTPSFYGYDGHGNVRVLENMAGAVTDTYQYDAFGIPIASTGATPNADLYSGERFDPNIGRFETMDPYAGSTLDPPTLHKYLYAGGDPVNGWDPTGRGTGEYATLLANESRSVFDGSLACRPPA